MKINHNDKCDDTTSTQQRQETDSRANVLDNKQNCVTEIDTPKNMIMKSCNDCMKGEIKTRSGQISCRPVRLGKV